jgi:4-diphosphocytidyl-2-C-methyl-D-erythritol kinase
MTGVPPHLELAHAKVNLRLAVLAREAGGFHQIETVFCALELADEVEVIPGGDGLSLDVVAPPEGGRPPPELGPVQQNLAWRAAALFYEHTGEPARVGIRLVKRIPAGAGLGGGSSDAAAVLRALNTLHDAPLSPAALLGLGARLGSDVPFFLSGARLALAWGRGSRIAPLPALPARSVLLAVPSIPVATAAAYADLARARGDDWTAPPAVLEPGPRSWAEAAAHANNDFEDVVFARLPQLAELRRAIENSGALIARMTGTGSTVFGVYGGAAAAEQARVALAAEHREVEWIATATKVG